MNDADMLDEFRDAIQGPGVRPGNKVDRWLERLPDDYRQRAVAALTAPRSEIPDPAIVRVFAKWGTTLEPFGVGNPPKSKAVELWRNRHLDP